MPKPSPVRQHYAPTQKQIEYLEILFNDCGFSRAQSRDYLSLRVGRTIKYLDELSGAEASRFIADMKAKREDARQNVGEEGIGWSMWEGYKE